MRTRRRETMKTVAGLLMLFSLVGAEQALACSCAPPAPPRESLATAASVFSGEAVAIDRVELSGRTVLRVTFDVQRVWKGSCRSPQYIYTSESSASCGYPFRVRNSYLVYTYADASGRLYGSLCS